MKKKHTQENRNGQVAMTMPVERPIENKPEKVLEETLKVPVDTLPHVTRPEQEYEQDTQNRYGYQDINSAPRNGTLIIVSETGNDKGEIVFWKRTRAFANATHKWEETGFFAGNISNSRTSFVPKFWRMRGVDEV